MIEDSWGSLGDFGYDESDATTDGVIRFVEGVLTGQAGGYRITSLPKA
jgi:hypothetical protein